MFGFMPNIHTGYAFVAAVFFVPIMLFYLWAMRSQRGIGDHGIGSRERWLGEEGASDASTGGDD